VLARLAYEGKIMKNYRDVFTAPDRAGLIPFFVLGDPDAEKSFDLIKTAIDAGADAVELGIPFSDPIADGPTIQKADFRALAAGMTPAAAIRLIERVKQYRDVPLGLLVYYNLVWQYGLEKFYADVARAGVNSVLIADLCVDDADEVQKLVERYKLESVYMITPNTTPDRIKKVVGLCTGFIYTVAVVGVTGARGQLGEQIVPLVQKLKQLTATPVCVGFGVSRPDHARQLAQAGADGVIVGSAVVNIIEQNLENHPAALKKLHDFLVEMRQAAARK
jgi:tryptophan synthase alpha chain